MGKSYAVSIANRLPVAFHARRSRIVMVIARASFVSARQLFRAVYPGAGGALGSASERVTRGC